MRRRPEVAIGVAVGAILLVALVAVLVSAGRGPQAYPIGSAERTLQSYLEAVISGEKVTAFSYVSEESPCSQRDMDNAYIIDVTRADIISTRTDGPRYIIRVRIEQGGGGVFGDTYSEEHNFVLVKEMGDWKITDGAWPMYSCGEWVK